MLLKEIINFRLVTGLHHVVDYYHIIVLLTYFKIYANISITEVQSAFK